MTDLHQIRLLILMVAGWISREQVSAISYLVEENRVLKEQFQASGKRLLLTGEQRRRLAAKGKALGARLFRDRDHRDPGHDPERHRELIAVKWTYPRRRVGRPGVTFGRDNFLRKPIPRRPRLLGTHRIERLTSAFGHGDLEAAVASRV